MKKTILIIAAILIPLIGSAQEGKELYNKHAGKKGVQAVYISSTMFELMKSIPDIEMEVEDVNLSGIIKTFDGMYILSVEDRTLAAELSDDMNKRVGDGKYELLMSAIDEDETMNIYIRRKKDTVTDFVMVAVEKASTSVISISATMPFEELRKLLGEED